MSRRTYVPRYWLAGLALLGLLPVSVRAHTVLAQSHDRTIVVRLRGEVEPGRLVIAVEYRLELDDATVFADLMAVDADVTITHFRDHRRACYQKFTDDQAAVLGRNLSARLDGRSLDFKCIKKGYTLYDEQQRRIGHLRCDYEYQAEVALTGAKEHVLRLKEGNYFDQTGRVWLALATLPPIRLLAKTVPSEELQKKQEMASIDLGPGEDNQLREIEAKFELSSAAQSETAQPPRPRPAAAGHESGLVDYLMDPDYTFWLLLVLFAAFGAVHALTPGHGKTLVAAYLVGERGTVWHALFLGLVTTLTHTGMVILVAIGLWWYFPQGHIPTENEQNDVEFVLGLAGGFVITLLGFWLLLRRLSGQADHFHVGGHHHHQGHGHYHHHHGDHTHDDQGNVVPLAPASWPVSWWGLLVLGVTGGLIPCWDAVFILIYTVGRNTLWMTLPLLLAFSAGLATVLIVIGILVVYLKGSASARWGESRLVRVLPLASAALVTGLGLWLCYDSVHKHAARSRPTALRMDHQTQDHSCVSPS